MTSRDPPSSSSSSLTPSSSSSSNTIRRRTNRSSPSSSSPLRTPSSSSSSVSPSPPSPPPPYEYQLDFAYSSSGIQMGNGNGMNGHHHLRNYQRHQIDHDDSNDNEMNQRDGDRDGETISQTNESDEIIEGIRMTQTRSHPLLSTHSLSLTPRHLFLLGFLLFSLGFIIFFDVRTHIAILCFASGVGILYVSLKKSLIQRGGILNAMGISAERRRLLTDFTLLELSQMSWTSQHIYDSISLLTFNLTEEQIREILLRMPVESQQRWMGRGIINVIPPNVRRLLLNNNNNHNNNSSNNNNHNDDDEKNENIYVERKDDEKKGERKENLMSIFSSSSSSSSPSPPPSLPLSLPLVPSPSLDSAISSAHRLGPSVPYDSLPHNLREIIDSKIQISIQNKVSRVNERIQNELKEKFLLIFQKYKEAKKENIYIIAQKIAQVALSIAILMSHIKMRRRARIPGSLLKGESSLRVLRLLMEIISLVGAMKAAQLISHIISLRMTMTNEEKEGKGEKKEEKKEGKEREGEGEGEGEEQREGVRFHRRSPSSSSSGSVSLGVSLSSVVLLFGWGLWMVKGRNHSFWKK